MNRYKVMRMIYLSIISLLFLRVVDSFFGDYVWLDSIFLIALESTIFVVMSNKMIREVEDIVFEDVRQSILKEYELTDTQVRFKISNGDSVYVENVDEGAFVMLSGTGKDKVIIKNVYSGREIVCELKKFLKSLNGLTSRGYKMYDPKSYEELLERGYGLQYEEY